MFVPVLCSMISFLYVEGHIAYPLKAWPRFGSMPVQYSEALHSIMHPLLITASLIRRSLLLLLETSRRKVRHLRSHRALAVKQSIVRVLLGCLLEPERPFVFGALRSVLLRAMGAQRPSLRLSCVIMFQGGKIETLRHLGALI
jgi:hypothetical protein